jgi:dienelactone hydrolase
VRVFRTGGTGCIALLCAGLVAAGSAQAFDPAVEAKNFSKTNERAAIYSTPEYQALLRQVSAQNELAAEQIAVTDPERRFDGQLCRSGNDGCAGDARLYGWKAKDYGIMEQVLYTARDGATISGRVWATKAGPAKRPGIVITNGSVQADENLYWFAAQTLAKAGYVVMTSDPQGQGQSDTRGEGADADEGFPAQSDGRPFFDGTQDALEFFFSTPETPYRPLPSCTTGTSHAAKQDRRVKAKLNAAYNPYAALLDPSRVGVAGHSYGAAGVSYVGQADPRVKAIVAWDNLAGTDPSTRIKPCPADPSRHKAVPITKPGLGLSADYFLPPTPNSSDPDPLAKSVSSMDYTKAGVDTGELIIRGGTHYDFDWIPNPGFPATLRGADLITWYTTAWFDKYVKGDPTADARLLTDRWRRDLEGGAVDPDKDANLFSFYYRSRLDIGRAGGGRFRCEDLRPGCPGLSGADGVGANYAYLPIVTSPDGPATSGNVPRSTGGLRPRAACTSRRVITATVRAGRGVRIGSAVARVGRTRVGRASGRRIVLRLRGLPKGRTRVVITARGRRHGRTVRIRLVRTFILCAPRRR